MKRITRREFLNGMAAGAGVLVLSPLLSGCSKTNLPPTEPVSVISPTSTEEIEPTNTLPPTQASSPLPNAFPTTSPTLEKAIDTPTASPAPTQTPLVNADLVIARNGEPEDMVRRMIAALGGMEKFVSKGAKVIVKPNICVGYNTYEYAATTNPWVVAALVKLCIEAGASKVQVMDFPFGSTPERAYDRSGIAEQVKAAGGEMVIMSSFKYIQTDLPQGKDIKNWKVYEDILKADAWINVPIAKTHGLAKLTLGMKNLMGIVQNREGLHRNLGQRLPDLASRLMPTLTVIDAVRIMISNGPTGGSLADVKQLNTILASKDIVAADSYATRFFNLKPEDIDYIKAGAEMGLGTMDLSTIKIEEI